MYKDVGMACQKICKQGRDNIKVKGATGKHGNAGTETGTEATKRRGKSEPGLQPYSCQESQISHELAPHWVHSSISKLIRET